MATYTQPDGTSEPASPPRPPYGVGTDHGGHWWFQDVEIAPFNLDGTLQERLDTVKYPAVGVVAD
jgi:hypothetical protein